MSLSSSCFLPCSPLSPSATFSYRRPTFRCVLNERKSITHNSSASASASPSPSTTTTTTTTTTSRTSSKRFYYFPDAKNVSSPNYRVLPDDEPNKPPPPPVHYTFPIFGYFLDLIFKNPTRREKARRFGGVFTSSGLLSRMQHITDYNAICEMLTDWQTFNAKGSSVKQIDMFGETAMNLLDGKDHARSRARLAPLFSPKVFPIYFQFILQRATSKWNELAQQSANGQIVRLDPEFRDLYLSIGIELTTGLTKNDVGYGEILQLLTRLTRAFSTPRFGPIFDDAMKAKERLIDLISVALQGITLKQGDIIEKLRTYGEQVFSIGGKQMATTDVNMALMMIASNDDIQPGVQNDLALFRDVAMGVYGLWFASFSTSAVTSSCAMFEMLQDPETLSIMRNEQEAIVANTDGEREIQYTQLSKMEKLESLVNESLRLHPVAFGVLRKCVRDVEVFGKRIDKGDIVWFDFATAMLNEGYYPDPESFKWDRFVKKEGSPPVPKVLTFGPPGGPHFCQGFQFAYLLMKTTFAIMLREYVLKLDPNASEKYVQYPENIPESLVAVSEIRPRGSS